jgi:S-adenosylmethionine synthetase
LFVDYVFDGTSPPYVPSAQPNPVNNYGITKRDAELGVLGVEGARVVVLRIPILCVSIISPNRNGRTIIGLMRP